MKINKGIVLIFILLAIGGSIYYLEALKPEVPYSSIAEPIKSGAPADPMPKKETPDSKSRIAAKSLLYPPAYEISTPDGFINSEGFRLGDLVGDKVILLDIWTYSCINCQRTLPYLKSWDDKYRDSGLAIVGLHTPEFEFEKDYENVKSAVEKFGIEYPVVLDNDYSTWTAYRNKYWPRKYLIDIDGFVVYDHIGEGGYEETEREIQRALSERAEILGIDGGMAGRIVKTEVTPESSYVLPNSPEVYFGAFRNELLANGPSGVMGIQQLRFPDEFTLNKLYLSGDWNLAREYAENLTAGSKIGFRYRAKEVYFVASADKPVKIRVLRDGLPVGVYAGEDIDENGSVTIQEDRLYKLINDPGLQGMHVLEIQIENPGLKAFTFTFG